MKNKRKTPNLTINDATKFYFATQRLEEGPGSRFFIASLFLPRDAKTGSIALNPVCKEVAAFSDYETYDLYSSALEHMCILNTTTQLYKEQLETRFAGIIDELVLQR